MASDEQTLTDLIPPGDAANDPDALHAVFTAWAAGRGTSLYPHQEEALLHLLDGSNVVLATPTGSGKSLVATAACFLALARDQVAFLTAPIKALVSEKFFDACRVFGAQNVGMLTGDAAVNADAPIVVCTAEVLANIALREGAGADIGVVVMDEFHYYGEPDRGWAWQVPLLTLPQAQFVLMSATLGDTTRFQEDLTRRTGRDTVLVAGAERPVPLHFAEELAMTPIGDTITELLEFRRAPVYVVHFTQKDALERAQALLSVPLVSAEEKEAIRQRIGAFRFTAGFGRVLSQLVRHGIGVHHAGMLPRYRRLVEQLAQDGLLKVICGTDTLGVGINVPIRTVLFTGLAKFDGSRQRILRAREFHQIAGRAGRAGYDSEGYVVVQAPEHAIENARLLAKAGDDPVKLKRVQRRKPPEGFVSWTQQTYDRLVAAEPESLTSRMKVDHSVILNTVARQGDPVTHLARLLRDNHETPAGQARLARRAISLGRSMLDSGVLVRTPDQAGRSVDLAPGVAENFALNQPLAPFALAALELFDQESPTYALDVLSVVEAVLDDPMPVLLAQRYRARGEAVAQMKADGVDYEERTARLEEISWPQPLAELLEGTLTMYRQTNPWVREDALSPKSVVRDMWERAMSFTEMVGYYQLARSEGVVLRYLTDCYRTLRQTIPAAALTPELEDLVHWLGETIRQTDSSLLEEWEALTDPERVAEAAAREIAGAPPVPVRAITGNDRAFRVMVRKAMWRRVELVADDAWEALGDLEAQVAALPEPALEPLMDRDAWDAAVGDYYDDHDQVVLDADARGPQHLRIATVAPGQAQIAAGEARRVWRVVQTVVDPEGDLDWVIEAECDLDASDAVGEPVLLATALRRLGG